MRPRAKENIIENANKGVANGGIFGSSFGAGVGLGICIGLTADELNPATISTRNKIKVVSRFGIAGGIVGCMAGMIIGSGVGLFSNMQNRLVPQSKNKIYEKFSKITSSNKR